MFSLTPVLLPFSTKPPVVTRIVPEVPAPITARPLATPVATAPANTARPAVATTGGCTNCGSRAAWLGVALVAGGLLWWCLQKG